MMADLRLCVFCVFFAALGYAQDNREQMRSWYNFLNSIGNTNIKLDSEAPADYVEEQSQDINEVMSSLRFDMQEADDTMESDSYCTKETAARLKQYCSGLHDGEYFDPWNPYCGFIRCVDQVPKRVVCARGSWMGMVGTDQTRGQNFMCRRTLAQEDQQIIDEDICPAKTDQLNLCDQAEKVSGMNEMM